MIDWDNAPEGATHWHKNYGWLKAHHHGVDVYLRKSWFCNLNHTALDDAVPFHKPKIKENKQMNDWLKVGNTIEVFANGDWYKEKVIAITEIEDEMTFTVTNGWDRVEYAQTWSIEYFLEKGLIRPVKTEKEKWVEKAYKTYEEAGTVELMVILENIYNAGLAKF